MGVSITYISVIAILLDLGGLWLGESWLHVPVYLQAGVRKGPGLVTSFRTLGLGMTLGF